MESILFSIFGMFTFLWGIVGACITIHGAIDQKVKTDGLTLVARTFFNSFFIWIGLKFLGVF